MNRTHAMAMLLALAAFGVQAQTIYKFVGRDGVIEYSSTKPPEGTKVLSEMEAKSLSREQQNAFERQRLANAARGAQVDAEVTARIKRLNDADAAIRAAHQRLQRAEAALQAGREPLPGERRGTVRPGLSRLTEEYVQRIARLEQNVEDARRGLDAAYVARNQL